MHIRFLILPLVLLTVGAAPTERRFMLTEFQRVRLDGPFTVEILTGKPGGATVIGEGRAAERVDLHVDGGTLVIGTTTMGWDGWRDGREGGVVIKVQARQLYGARVNGGGRITVDRMAGTRIDIGVNGSGRLKVGTVTGDQLLATLTGTGALDLSGGSVQRARFFTQGAGSIDAVGASASELNVQAQSSGDSRFYARLTAAVNSSGSGAVRVEGPAACRLSGSGPMSCTGKTERR